MCFLIHILKVLIFSKIYFNIYLEMEKVEKNLCVFILRDNSAYFKTVFLILK